MKKFILLVSVLVMFGAVSVKAAELKTGVYIIASDSENRMETLTSAELYRKGNFSANLGYAVKDMLVASISYDLPIIKDTLKAIPGLGKIFDIVLVDSLFQPSVGVGGSWARLTQDNEFEYGLTVFGVQKTIKF